MTRAGNPFFAGTRREYLTAVLGLVGAVTAAISQVEVQRATDRSDTLTRAEADKRSADQSRYEDLLHACLNQRIDDMRAKP